MKNRWLLFLSLFLFMCSQLESIGLEASSPRILSTPADGSVFHGERNVTPGYGQVVSEVWTPTKPEDYYYVKIGINATGYGEVAFTLNGSTRDYDIGNWRSEPLQKANNDSFTHRVRYLTNIINEARVGFTDEISPTTVSISATGSALTRSRSITTYSSEQEALTAQASVTGPSVGFVIGESTYWKWEAGITRTVNADAYNGNYEVTINDTNVDPGSSSGSGSTGSLGGNPGSSPTMLACGVHSSGTSGDHSLQASCSTDSSCISTNFYLCSHSHSYPPPPPPTTVSCGRSACSASVSSSTEHQSSPCSAGHTYWTCNPGVNVSNWLNKHRVRTCRRSGCGQSWQACVDGWNAPQCNAKSGSGCWAQ